jgi:ABC-type bacteriocin/lantibiotic exporter with double-glycine peptidase domain
MLSFRVVGLRISAKIRYEYLNALFALPVSVLDTVPTGQTSTTITATANTLQLGISEKLGILIQFSALLIASIIIVGVLPGAVGCTGLIY